MFKLIKGNPLYIQKFVAGETFKVKIKLWYRYNLFKFTKIEFEEELSEELTYKNLLQAIREQITKLDKICKNT